MPTVVRPAHPLVTCHLSRHLYHCAATAHQIDDQEDYGEHQQEVYEAAERVAAHHAEQPKYEQYHEDGPEHNILLQVGFVSPRSGCHFISPFDRPSSIFTAFESKNDSMAGLFVCGRGGI